MLNLAARSQSLDLSLVCSRVLSLVHVKTRIVPVEAERHSGHSAQVCFEAQPRHRHRCEHGSSRTARDSYVVKKNNTL